MTQFGIGQPVRRVEDRRFLTGRGRCGRARRRGFAPSRVAEPRQQPHHRQLDGAARRDRRIRSGRSQLHLVEFDPGLAFRAQPVGRTNPLGVKGAGEAGAIGAPPALVNAVIDAVGELGIDHLDMPLTPETVWRALRAAAASKVA